MPQRSAYTPRRKDKRPQRPAERRRDQRYYRRNRQDIRRDQRKYWDKESDRINRERRRNSQMIRQLPKEGLTMVNPKDLSKKVYFAWDGEDIIWDNGVRTGALKQSEFKKYLKRLYAEDMLPRKEALRARKEWLQSVRQKIRRKTEASRRPYLSQISRKELNVDLPPGTHANMVDVARKKKAAVAGNPLNGFRKRQAVRFVLKLMEKHSKGFFDDEYWKPIHAIFKDMRRIGIDYTLNEANYGLSPSGRQMGLTMDDYKEWKGEIDFLNNRGRPSKLYFLITASGAGSMADPLERYDVTTIVS